MILPTLIFIHIPFFALQKLMLSNHTSKYTYLLKLIASLQEQKT